MATTTVRNGIDVDQLLETIEATQTDDAVGTFTFRASSTWKDGTQHVQATSPVRDIIANEVPVATSLEVV